MKSTRWHLPAENCAATGPNDLRMSPQSAVQKSAVPTETADDIRRAALRLFAREGYEATSMREIAGAVGIKAGSLYNHFASKEEILWDLTQSAMVDLKEQVLGELADLGDQPTPAQRLEVFIRAHVRFHAENGEKATLVNRQMPGLSATHYRQVIAMRSEFEQILETILTDGAAAGEFNLVQERVTRYALLQMGIAVATWYRRGGGISVETLCDIYTDLGERLVGVNHPTPVTTLATPARNTTKRKARSS
jgi:AcrR family transcriptional regulator